MKTKTIILLVCGIVLFLFVSYVMIFIIIRPFMGMITEDRPLVKKLCEMQEECFDVLGLVKCGITGHSFEDKRLLKAKSYHGCNESTESYSQTERNHYVNVEVCSCGGLM